MTERLPVAQRKSQRLPDFDYSSAGAYFFTVCTKGRLALPGRVISDEVKLTPAGEAVKQVWLDLPSHYQAIELDQFITMPNHVHGNIWILSEPSQLEYVGEGLRPSPTDPSNKPSLPELIRAFKSFSAREVNKIRGASGSFWQRGFYEHIIRNDDDLYQHRAYVQNNPLKWSLDEYYQ